MSLEEIVRSLKSLGIDYKVLETGTDGAALVLPEYGRILGLWPVWRGENAFWVNPEFFRFLEIGAKQTEWVNPGGDRMWLYPEAEFFDSGAGLPGETHGVPHALDPGKFAEVADKGVYGMENRGDLWAHRSGVRIAFKIVRRIRVYSEKELAKLWGQTYMRQAGYDEETSLEVVDSPIVVGLWNVACLAAGGRAYLPLDRPMGAKPPARGFEVRDGCAVIPCSGEAAVKVWLDASEVKSRGAYVIDNGETGRSTLVLKEFEKVPIGRYAGEGAAGFSCVGGHSPSCEMAFRSSATWGVGGKKKTVWRHSSWAFSGRIEEVREFLRRITA